MGKFTVDSMYPQAVTLRGGGTSIAPTPAPVQVKAPTPVAQVAAPAISQPANATTVQPTTTYPTTSTGAFMPATIAGFNPQQVQAFDRAIAQPTSNPMTDWAQSILKDAYSSVAPKATASFDQMQEVINRMRAPAKTYNPASAMDYYNPMVEQYINPVVERLKREAAIRDSEISSQASRVNAFGDTAYATQRSMNDEALGRTLAEFLGTAKKGAYDDALSNSRSQFNTEQDDDYRRLSQSMTGLADLGRNYLSTLSPAASMATTGFNFGTNTLDRERDKTQDILGVGTMARNLEQEKLNAIEAQRLGYNSYDWEQIKKLMDVTSAYPKTGTTATSTPAPASTYGQASSLLNLLASGLTKK